MASDFIVPEFLEDCDADTIHARMMDELPNDIDKTEGGFPWDFTRPTALIAAELLQFYIPEAIKLMFPQWSSGSFLDYLAAGSQTKRKASTYAEAVLTLTGEPGTIVPAGTVFATEAKNDQPSIEFAAVESCILNEVPHGKPLTQPPAHLLRQTETEQPRTVLKLMQQEPAAPSGVKPLQRPLRTLVVRWEL